MRHFRRHDLGEDDIHAHSGISRSQEGIYQLPADVHFRLRRADHHCFQGMVADHEGRKKALDLLSRRTIAEHSRDALFVSIHMNAFPQSQYSGTQVWYGTKDALSREISHSIQQSALWLQPENRRKIKAASSSIYLLDQIPSPCVLVECGFLSNPTEAERLSDPNYQKALAVMIFAGISPYVTAPLNH